MQTFILDASRLVWNLLVPFAHVSTLPFNALEGAIEVPLLTLIPSLTLPPPFIASSVHWDTHATQARTPIRLCFRVAPYPL